MNCPHCGASKNALRINEEIDRPLYFFFWIEDRKLWIEIEPHHPGFERLKAWGLKHPRKIGVREMHGTQTLAKVFLYGTDVDMLYEFMEYWNLNFVRNKRLKLDISDKIDATLMAINAPD